MDIEHIHASEDPEKMVAALQRDVSGKRRPHLIYTMPRTGKTAAAAASRHEAFARPCCSRPREGPSTQRALNTTRRVKEYCARSA